MSELIQMLPILIALLGYVFAIYVVIKVLKLMKQRNEYLKEIRDELKKDKNDLFCYNLTKGKEGYYAAS